MGRTVMEGVTREYREPRKRGSEYVILSPSEYSSVSVYDLLEAVDAGYVPLDHKTLHAIVDDPKRSIPDLLRFGARDDVDDIWKQDLTRIFRHLRTPESLPFFVQLLRDDSAEPIYDMVLALREIGPPVVEPLLALYKEGGDEPNPDIPFILASLGVNDPRITELLTRIFRDDPQEGSHLLATYGDSSTLSLVEEVMGTLDPAEQTGLASAIQRFGEEQVEEEEFDLWEAYPREEEPDFERLEEEEVIRFLDSPEPLYREGALIWLSAEELPEPVWPKVLEMAKTDPDPVVRGRAWQCLSDAWDFDGVAKELRATLENDKLPLQERAGALVAVATRLGDHKDVQQLMLEFYKDPEVRAKAMQAMSLSADPRFSEYFVRHLDDEDIALQLQAIQGVGYLEITPAAQHLVEFFQEAMVREEAITAYALCADFPANRRGMRQLLEKIDRLSGGLTEDEEQAVKLAINFRLHRYDMEPLFNEEGDMVEEEFATSHKVGRNDPCPCGSGKKYKKCCGA